MSKTFNAVVTSISDWQSFYLQEGDVAKAKELLKKETKETIDQVQHINLTHITRQ